MWKLLKYTKPYILMIIFSIGLLYAQANLELALPDYLSDIVDTGIQQGGVENAVPIAIRQTEMDRLLIFMSDDNGSTVLEDYLLIDENNTDYSTYLEEYPALVNGSIYILKDKEQLFRYSSPCDYSGTIWIPHPRFNEVKIPTKNGGVMFKMVLTTYKIDEILGATTGF